MILLTSFRLLVVLFFIVAGVQLLLTEDPRVTLLMVIGSILILSQSRWLFNQYMKIESQFLTNLNGSKKEEKSLTEEEEKT